MLLSSVNNRADEVQLIPSLLTPVKRSLSSVFFKSLTKINLMLADSTPLFYTQQIQTKVIIIR
jgi:hypothetical protein